MKPEQIIEKAVDEEYRKTKREKTNKEVAGIFLTPAQKVIVECGHPFLVIKGLPGTGKTYCLILNMVNVFLELLQLHRDQPNRSKELITVFHKNKNTIHWIREMFRQTLSKQIEQQSNNRKEKTSLKEILKLIKFIGGSDFIDIETQEVFQAGDNDVETIFSVW